MQCSTMWSETCRLPQLLEGNMPGYSLAATRYDEDARKVGCARRVVGKHCNESWLCFEPASSWMSQAALMSIQQITEVNWEQLC